MSRQCPRCDIWRDKIYFRIPFTWYFIGKRTPPEAKKEVVNCAYTLKIFTQPKINDLKVTFIIGKQLFN